MKPRSTLGLVVAAGLLATAALTLTGATEEPPGLPAGPAASLARPTADIAGPATSLAAAGTRDPAVEMPRRVDETRASSEGVEDAPPEMLERIVIAMARMLAEGPSRSFDANARSAADALIEHRGSPEPEALEPWLANPDTTVAAAVLAGHLGWTELPHAALDAVGALWNDARLEGAGEGLEAADAAHARALAVAPTLYRFGSSHHRDALLGDLIDPSPLRRRLARAAAAGAEPVDAARRLARLAVHVEDGAVEAEWLCIALRQDLDRVSDPAALDPLTLEILRERADAWQRSSGTVRARASALEHALARFPR